MLIIPAINTSDKDKAVDQIKALNDVILPHGYDLERVQIDINDGTFEDIVTITPDILSEMDVKFRIDYQLMVNEPVSWIDKCIRGKADVIIGHVEYMKNQREFVENVVSKGKKAGLGLSIETPVGQIDNSLFSEVDTVLLVSYPAGKGGKEFNEGVYSKIDELREIKDRNGYSFKICLDGGISEDNIKRVKLAGVDEVAMTKRILEGDIEENLEKCYKLMY